MSYRQFTLKMIGVQFAVSITERPDLFADAAEVEPSPRLMEWLEEYVPLALDINTEKARSEFIIAPLLGEVRSRLGRRISLFSGVEFNVDEAQGLNGVCDFLLSRSPQQLFIDSPVVSITEAKNEDMKGGMGQCLAAMIAARLFNERDGRSIEPIFGAVTTGTIWRFLEIKGQTVSIDEREYYLPAQLAKILGIFIAMFPASDTQASTDRRTEAIGKPSIEDH